MCPGLKIRITCKSFDEKAVVELELKSKCTRACKNKHILFCTRKKFVFMYFIILSFTYFYVFKGHFKRFVTLIEGSSI